MPATASTSSTLSVGRHADGVVEIAFAVPGLVHNVVREDVLADLEQALDALSRPTAGWRPRCLVIRSAREGCFFAGTDVDWLESLPQRSTSEIERLCDRGRQVIDRLSASPWPSVAIIDGTCLGGGLELALGCDLRVATSGPHTIFGLPEVKLGLLPCWGATVRLPRLIGVGAAVELTVGGETIGAAEAERLGLVDARVPASAALETARRLVDMTDGLVSGRRRGQQRRIELDSQERGFLERITEAVILGRTGGHYPAPPAILHTIVEGSGLMPGEAAGLESAAFARLVKSPESRQLLRVFRIGERNRLDPGIGSGDPDLLPVGVDPPPARVTPAVVGAGIMGTGIAAAHLQAGFAVTLIDANPDALAAGAAAVLAEATGAGGSRRADPTAALALAGRMRLAVGLESLAGADLVIESVAERPDVKQRVLAEIEAVVEPQSVIATNTSTNPITRLAESLVHPQRFCGMHFFNPVRRMTLVEVVRGPATSDATVATAVAHAKRLGKCPIVVRDSPGFLVNRVLMPYLNEAVEMAREGIPCTRIDRAARGFGMPLGPLELYDMIGLDTAFYAGLVLDKAYGDRIEPSPVVPALVKAGRLGHKSGAGFYAYADASASGHDGRSPAGPRPRASVPDDVAGAILDRYRTDRPLPSGEPTDQSIVDRLFLPMLLEALRTLDEGIVRDSRDIDLALIHALGFPAFRGGLLAWADQVGAAAILGRLQSLEPLGPRMRPTERLTALARDGGSFASPANGPRGRGTA
jgi:3-hydroxyacyl-CoA dehydrogenase/enoyl-CoA hydratase/carnithine racemase